MDDRVVKEWLMSKPRFISDALVRRVVLRGSPIMVIQDPATGRHWRATVPLYRIISMLDGRTPVAEALSVTGLDKDEAGANVLLRGLAGMAGSGLLRMPGIQRNTDNPSAATALRQMLQRVVFMRIPLGNLGAVLPYANPILGWLFTGFGMAIWLSLLAMAGRTMLGEGPAIREQFERLSQLGPRELAVGWLMFATSKMLHEIGHALAASRAGAAEGLDLRSFRWGISFMFLLPAPYVDVSPSWLVASRWRRAQVGLAGIQVDLLIAALATLLWAELGEGFVADRLFELVLLCGVSSLLFNANPLIRLDGYYVLSDLLEIPNLQTRSWVALRNIGLQLVGLGREPIRRGDWGYALYSAASWTWRWSVFIAIFWLAGGVSSTVAYGFALIIGVLYLAVPLGRGIGPWLSVAREFPLKAAVAPLVIAAFCAILLMVPVPVHIDAEGIVSNESLNWVYAPADGIVSAVAVPGTTAGTLMRLDNPELRRTLVQLRAESEALAIQARRARAESQQKADALGERQRAVASQIVSVEEEMATWITAATGKGSWHPLRAEMLDTAWVRRDDQRPLGVIVSNGPIVLRMVFDQWDGPAALAALSGLGSGTVPVRRRGESRASLQATVLQLPNQARDELPSQALSVAAGGPIAVRPDARGVSRPSERIFEARLAPLGPLPELSLRHGERVEAHIRLADSTLAALGWRRLRQALQRRLSV